MISRRVPVRCCRYISQRSSALDLNPFIVNETLSSQLLFKFTEKSSLQFNFFLQALSNNDIPLGFKIIKHFQQSNLHTFDSLYYQCLSLVFFQLVADRDSLNIRVVKSYIDQVAQKNAAQVKLLLKNDKSYDVKVFKANILRCLLYCYENTPSKLILRYANKVFDEFSINVNELVDELSEDDVELFEKTFKYEVKRLKQESTKQNQVSDHPVTLKKLLGIISGTEDMSQSKKIPLYETYEDLPDNKKHSFWETYRSQNTVKQFQVEASCEEVLPDFTSGSSKKATKGINKFSSYNYEMLDKWIKDSVNEIMTVLQGNSGNKTGHQNPILVYGFVLRGIEIDRLVLTILSQLLAAVLTNENGYVKLVSIVDTCSQTISRYFKASPTMNVPEKFLSKETKMKLSESILQVIVANSFIDPELLKNCEYNKSGELYRPSHMLEYEASFRGFGFKVSKLSDTSSSSTSIKTPKIIRCHSYLLTSFTELDSKILQKKMYLPMLVPPKPWTSKLEGGYFTNIRPFMLTEEVDSHNLYLERAQQSGQLSSIFTCLNQLGETPWAINPSVLRVFTECMKLPSGFLTIPPPLEFIQNEHPKMTYPTESAYDNLDDLHAARVQYWREYKKSQQVYFTNRSERFKYFYVEAASKAFAENGDTLYFPHGVDFRGRIYPLNSVLSYHLEDLTRALLMFWHAKPLGQNGFAWLKYQLAGVYGHDKLPFDDRIKWVDENIDNILYLGNSVTPWSEVDQSFRWWMESEKPWQTYALCKELAKIHGYEGDKSLYKCRIPIHQDGSCNGLQHYAALSLDYEGGKAVNLVPSKHRQDVYSTVLGLVQEQVEKDVLNGDEVARLVLPLLSRSVVKRTVMTSVYGVTRNGAYKQIEEVVKLTLDKHKNYKKDVVSGNDLNLIEQKFPKVIEYLTILTLNSIKKLFPGAKLIENWLTLVCLFVVKSFDKDAIEYKASLSESGTPDFFDSQSYKPMMWTSLSGLPIVQTYKHYKYKNLAVSSGTLRLKEYSEIGAIDYRKQKNGVAPNFIHSVDSIHLQMTCLRANLENLGFAAVHDSFWTYPSDTDQLNTIIREEFVELHKSEVLESLRSDLLYTTRNSLQLCWVSKQESEEFYRGLRKIREDQLQILQSSRHALNEALYEESKKLLNPNENQTFVSRYTKLLQDFKPKLYFQIKKGTLLPLGENTSVQENAIPGNITLKEYEPLLVPVNIPNCPPKGQLNLNGVMESEFFFS